MQNIPKNVQFIWKQTTSQTCQPPKGKKCEILNLELGKVVRNG